MKRFFLFLGLLGALAALVSWSIPNRSEAGKQDKPAAEQGQEKTEARATADRSADEAAIRQNVDAFVKAYNAQDAKAIAALFTPRGQVVDEQGNASEGREAIEQTFKDLFIGNPQKRIEVNIESIRFVGPTVAIEEGSTKETSSTKEIPEYDRYTVLHVKQDGKWQMALAQDAEGDTPTPQEELRPLAWLVGDWIDDGGSTVVKSSCRWSDDRNFLLQEFDLQVNGKNAMKVSQRIGWDPVVKRIRSWVFDSEGGFGQSLWTRDGDTWIIKATGVRPDGKTASATNVFVPAGTDAYLWRSRDRIVGDEVSPPMEVKVVRKPPSPGR
jgi:uncharacterized protein (TIGR02246 family)